MSDTRKSVVNFKFRSILDNNGMTSDAAINTLTRFLFEKEQARKYKTFLHFCQGPEIFGDIDFGDGCWRQFVLVTNISVTKK